jgi:gamma-glutamyltranspeptidase/glutathione hydrolase
VRHIRQFCVLPLGACAALLLLAACGSSTSETKPTETIVKDFTGAVVGDEPRAVVEARNALLAGGTAADGAVAMFFTMAATLPSSASLGSGGMCVVYDAKTAKVEALDFVARAPANVPATAERPSAIPGSPLGFWALHSRFGKLAWSQLVTPGERLARFGGQASRTLISDFTPVAAPLLEDPESRRVFADPTGQPMGEGTNIVQPDLARVLSVIRLGGAIDMYRGALARELSAAAKAAGGSLELSDLESYRAEWRPTIVVNYSSRRAHFAPPPAAAGAVEAQMFAMLADRFGRAGGVDRLHLLAETSSRAYADRARWMRADNSSVDSLSALVSQTTIDRLTRTFDTQRHTASTSYNPGPTARPENPSATSFVVMDKTGSTVSCTLTMNNSFGTGRMARGTGIVLSALPNAQGRGPLSLGPMLVMNDNSKQLFFAAGASGGVAAPTALVNVAARALLAEQPLEGAMRAPRIHHGGAPDITYHEPEAAREDILQLTSRGHTMAATPTLGIVNALSCTGGMPRDRSTCSAVTDPRGHGLAMTLSE